MGIETEGNPEPKWQFQGQEKIDELEINYAHFKWRLHDPAIGRFISVDPLSEKYVHNSTYAFSENKVTAHIELEGLEAVSVSASQKKKKNQVSLLKYFLIYLHK